MFTKKIGHGKPKKNKQSKRTKQAKQAKPDKENKFSKRTQKLLEKSRRKKAGIITINLK